MKAIKDIGREMWLDESLCGSPLNPALKFYRLYPSSDGECPTSDAPLSVRVYSESERRELVREALIILCKEWIYPKDAWDDVEEAAMSQIGALIREQGL